MIKFETVVQLSHVPSILIRTGLKDLRLCEGMPDVYEINEYEWHKPTYRNGICLVGLAGAVMAQTLKAPVDVDIGLDNFSEHNCKALLTLDYFRFVHDKHCMNKVCYLINAIFIEWNEKIPEYDKDKEGFHRVLNELADAFEASGQ